MARITDSEDLKECVRNKIHTDGFDIHDGEYKGTPLYYMTVDMRGVGGSSAKVRIFVYDGYSEYIDEINRAINENEAYIRQGTYVSSVYDIFRLFDKYIHENIPVTERFVSQYYTLNF